ncbi:AsnC family transcriptional regulator [Methylobacterium sp. Leaf92]|uniref:GntR family transcriptional regulator n=1 Tax=Methylorubrum extorquens TaxID=408 RepID=UPI0006F244C1|nr:GntR family transcriptional regulator [Methylorubrum extorquens]KQO99332.1 AsnC family transcriptional regulator [Methylobacterium sp. Leaf92]UYW27476.1 GntR family transcriptional regulator [Methylorubrum extorquens]
MRRAQALRDALEQEIITGKFRPGDRLDEQSLAARFEVSRTPIREALMQLASTGLVELQARRGAFVTLLSFKDVVERFEVMAALEGMCGALAARRITHPMQREIEKAHEDCVREASQESADAYYYANERFHHLIYKASQNTFLAEQATQLHARLKPYRRLQLQVRSRVANSLAEHQSIVDAIRNGDGEQTERMLREHILIQGERLADFFASFERAA